MSRGPERMRLDAAIDPADEGAVQTTGAGQWDHANRQLTEVVRGLRRAARSGLGIGGRTGPAMFTAMQRSADNLEERIADYVAGQQALLSAAETIQVIRDKRDRIDTDPATASLPHPGSFSDDPEWDDERRLTEQGRHTAAVNAYQEREALREQRAREIAEEYDRRYEEPIAVMKRIHGIPDPEPAPGGPGGGDGPGGRAPRGRGPGSSATTPGVGQPTHTGTGTWVGGVDGGDGSDPTTVPPRQPDPVRDPVTEGPGLVGPTTTLTTTPTGTPVTTGTIGAPGTTAGGLPGGLGTAVGVGLGGGALLGGLAKGGAALKGLGAGLAPGAQQTRPLGGLSRSAVSGTLGRGPAAGVSATGRPAGRGGVGAVSSAGRAGSARAAAGGRAGAGGGRAGAGVGAAGARAGAGAGGARGRTRREGEGPERELFEDDGSEWLDDEAAPGVLD